MDGIRAFAVLGVIVYHSGFSWLPGGFYGVDAFFALSGFLITSLLLAQWQRSSRIALADFWSRRARRLLPALFLMLAGVGALAAVWPRTLDTPYLRLDSLATIFYVANWHFILDHANYFFVTSQPSPLLHTWSLSIEEQFYLIWPLVVLAVLVGHRRGRGPARPGTAGESRRRLLGLFWLSVGGALASGAWMGLIAGPGGDVTRAYYGTDTRAQSLLVGAAFAVAVALWKPGQSPRAVRAMWWAGILGVAGTALTWSLIPETSTLAFRGGFLLASLSATAVIACVSQVPQSPVSRALAIAPLRALGRISYGVYLWYWPTLLVADHARTHLSGFALLAARLAIVIALATASYHLLEMPIRRGALSRWRARVALGTGAALALAVVFTTTALVAVPGFAGATSVSASASQGLHLPLSVRTGSATGAGSPSSTPPGSHPAYEAPEKGPPVKVLLVGDSMAGSLGVGMQQVQSRYGAEVVNEGHPGCSLGAGSLFKVLWYTVPPGAPCSSDGSPSGLLDAWRTWVDRLNPDVSVYLARTDLFDQSVSGTWEHVGQPRYDALLEKRLQEGIDVLSSRGGKVALLSSPYYDSGEQPSGQPWPEDSPARVRAYDIILARVAAKNPGTTVLIRLGSLISPEHHFASVVDGVPLRCGDGVHISVSGGRWIGEHILAELVSLGRQHSETSPSGSWPGYRIGAPSWFSKLPCAA